MSIPWPTLKQRIRAAKRALQEHSPTIQGADPEIQFIIDPVAAKHALMKHELVTGNYEDLSDDETSDCPAGPCTYANLYKPTKPTTLLTNALTNANGDAWFRQRYCVSRAFAVAKSLRVNCGTYAAEKMMEMIQQSQSSTRCNFFGVGRRNNDIISTSTLDVRYLAREVAVVAMLRMVFGATYGKQHEMIDGLRGMILDSLEPVRNDDKVVEARNKAMFLDGLVRGAIEAIALENDFNIGRNCLAKRLLEFERDEKEYYLTRDEVVSNAHSALLAGTQTICTTIAGALAHLAQAPDLQRDLKTGSFSGRDIVMETLRILPPVAGLPRYPNESTLEVPTGEKEDVIFNSRCPIEKGQMLIVDLLAFAHSQPTTDENGSVFAKSQFASLKFEPRKGKHSEDQPWGIGKRKCPAGIISVECISIIFEYISSRNVTWEFAQPKKDVVDDASCGGWIDSIRYCPTLQFSREIRIKFFESNF